MLEELKEITGKLYAEDAPLTTYQVVFYLPTALGSETALVHLRLLFSYYLTCKGNFSRLRWMS